MLIDVREYIDRLQIEGAMRYFLSKVDYDDKDHEAVGVLDDRIVGRGIETVGD